MPHGLALRTAAAGGKRPSVAPSCSKRLALEVSTSSFEASLCLKGCVSVRELWALSELRRPQGKKGTEHPPRRLSRGLTEFVREMCRTQWQIHRKDSTRGRCRHDQNRGSASSSGRSPQPASIREAHSLRQRTAQKTPCCTRAVAGRSGDFSVASWSVTACLELASHLSIDSKCI